jgi:hypothetical protein
MRDVTLTSLQLLVNKMAEDGYRKSAVGRVRTYLKSCFEYAADEDLIQKSPARKRRSSEGWPEGRREEWRIRRRTRATTLSSYRPISKANRDGPRAFLFQSSTGIAFGVGNYLRRYLKPLAERAGVPGVTHRAFRPPVRLKKRIEQKRVHSKNSGARGRLSARTHNRWEAVQPRGIWPRKCKNRPSPRDRRGPGRRNWPR